MATYNKRGYKAPKPELEADETVTAQYINDKDSETAEVFDTLDSTASKMGNWFTKNQKFIFGGILVLAVATVGYLGYNHFIVEPNEEKAANEMFQAQQYFDQAVNGQDTDSLYNLALNGGEGKMGFLKIAQDYSGTQAASISNYYAGMAYLNIGKFKEAIQHLEKFQSEDLILKATSLGAIGDSFSELNQPNEAFEYYVKAANHNKNDFTTPRFSFKAGLTALQLGKKEEALKLFTLIKEEYKSSPEAANVDYYLGMSL
ncbi:tetratricopeptide repeat protein [Flavobacterium sp. I3-2]|uniref:tetratricopeptide repeat protein n=1 Tax=Flavobacterium sp. I3-2 TaxID=2748319 RepID=UPI0015A95152|nr:tetratricopeptide repeat protein [Flavobacterium sp. I3-2]